MAKTTTQVIKGSSFLFTGTVEGLVNHHLSDAEVSLKVIFYGAGKYDEEESSKVTVAKSAMKFDPALPDNFTCYVNTTNLPLGNLAAALEVSYVADTEGAPTTIKEIIPVSFLDTTVQITNLK